MRFKIFAHLKAWGALVGVLLALAGCEKTDTLVPLDYRYPVVTEPAYVEVDFCAQKADVMNTRTKYLFVLDKSGSNTQNFQLNPDGSIAMPLTISPTLATDPQGIRRYQQLIQYLSTTTDDPNRYYGLINFSTSATLVRGFTNNRTSFRTTVQGQLTNLSDQGATNYLSALALVEQTINADIQAAIAAARANPLNKISSTYIVVFISDGFPILSINTATTPPTVNAQSGPEILQKVRDILTLQTDNAQYVDGINLFTGYYFVTGNEDGAAKQLLADMAKAGHGVAYTFGGTDVIDFSLFQVPSKTIKYSLAEIFVTNASLSWWDQSLLPDADRDGLPDEVERQFGSDSAKRDSDGNGVSDHVEYLVSANHKPCAQIVNGSCVRAGAFNYYTTDPAIGGCSSLTNGQSTASGLVFPDSDKDGLNDCEELALKNVAGLYEFDSNGDLIPDGLSNKGGLEFKAGAVSAFSDLDQDGMSSYNEIKFQMPVSFPNYQLRSIQPLNYDLTIVSSTAQQDCYEVKVENMQTLGAGNVVRVDLVESTSDVVNRKRYRVAEKAYSGTSKVLRITDDATEAAGVWK